MDLDTKKELPIAIMNELYNTIQAYYDDSSSIKDLTDFFRVSGSTMVSSATYLSITAPATKDVHEQTLTFTQTTTDSYTDATTPHNTVVVDGTTYTFTEFGASVGRPIGRASTKPITIFTVRMFRA